MKYFIATVAEVTATQACEWIQWKSSPCSFFCSGDDAEGIEVIFEDEMQPRLCVALPPPLFPKTHVTFTVEAKEDGTNALTFSGRAM